MSQLLSEPQIHLFIPTERCAEKENGDYEHTWAVLVILKTEGFMLYLGEFRYPDKEKQYAKNGVSDFIRFVEFGVPCVTGKMKYV